MDNDWIRKSKEHKAESLFPTEKNISTKEQELHNSFN